MKTNDSESDEAPAAIGGTIRELRRRRAMRQGDLAQAAGMSAAQLCHIEKDRNTPSVRTLRRIAEALGVPLAELAAPVEPAPVGGVPDAMEKFSMKLLSRPPLRMESRRPFLLEQDRDDDLFARESSPEEEDDDYISSLEPVGETTLDGLPSAARKQVRSRILEYHGLERKAGVPVRPSLPLDYPAQIETEDADALARAVRRAGGIADAVLFDSVAFLEGKGLRVVAADLPEGTEAFALWDAPARNAWIVIRKASTDERQQFRVACTLADLLRFVSGGAEAPVRDNPWNRRFARTFAASFLMPESALQELCYRLGLDEESWTYDLLLREKQRYSVSAEAFAYRLEALGLLKPSLRQRFVRRLRDHFAKHGTEPNSSQRKVLRHSRFSDLKMLVESKA